MRKNFGKRPLLFPQPVMIIGTYDAEGKPNIMNAAWGGIVGTNQILICLGSHKTTDNIAVNKEFTVSIGTKETVVACDYVGLVSGRNVPDKIEKSGFTTEKAEFVNAPIISELPVCMECKLEDILDGCLYIGNIVNVAIDEDYLGDDGKISFEKFHPITFETEHHTYMELGGVVGKAFSDGSKLK